MSGYMGAYAIVDLSSGNCETVKLTDHFYRKYLSGYGLGAAVITERQKAGIDPLAPESYLGFCTGLLTGSGAYFSGRYMVVGKSPLTNTWGDANSGGFFSVELKKAGFDALFVTGAARTPVWLSIDDGRIEIKDASVLWGKDVLDTEAAIQKEMGDKKVRIACIGVSGEKKSLISGVVTDSGRIAGRSGLGAVMGSKNLKAVAVHGMHKVPVAEPEAMKEINSVFLAEYKKSKLPDRIFGKNMKFGAYMANFFNRLGIQGGTPAPSMLREAFRTYGTTAGTVMSAMVGDSPIKNWGGAALVDFPVSSADKLADKKLHDYRKRRYACQACPLGCGAIKDIKKGRYQGTQGHRPEYETLSSFGSLLLNDDLDSIIEINELCNRAGIDTISTGGTVAFAIECYENGLIDEKATAGLKLGWGKSPEIIKLTEMIINREGIGDILADGVKRAAEKIGNGAEYFAIHAGGQELPMHDSRLEQGFGIAYPCEPTPGRHTISSFMYAPVMGVDKQFPRIEKMLAATTDKMEKNIIWYTAGTFFIQLINSSGVCEFAPLTSAYPLVEYLNFVTGWNLLADEYLTIGERILNLRKAFNMREGIQAEDTELHPRAAGNPPLSKGPTKGVTLQLEKLQKSFFAKVGWDPKSGVPTKQKLKELEIEHLFG